MFCGPVTHWHLALAFRVRLRLGEASYHSVTATGPGSNFKLKCKFPGSPNVKLTSSQAAIVTTARLWPLWGRATVTAAGNGDYESGYGRRVPVGGRRR